MSVMDISRLRNLAVEVTAELYSAESKHGLNLQGTLHESWGILEEEVDELWDEIKKGSRGSKEAVRKEAIQVAAMALRLIYVMDTQLRDAVGSEDVRSPAPPAPTTQRTSPSAIHLSLAPGSPEVHIAAASQRTAPDLCQAGHDS